MRLDDFDSNSVNIEDQRGGRRPAAVRGGKIGCGTLAIALIAALVFGVDPAQMIGGLEQMQQQTAPSQQGQAGSTASESCNADEASREACNALSSLNKTWQPLFAQANIDFTPPKLVFYSQAGQSGCGAAQSAMGPFYCPADNGIYLDTDFFRQMDEQLGAGGQFARLYVIAHEYGHHMQNVLGMSDQVRSLQAQNPSRANNLSVRLELQADCYAGVWAGQNRRLIEKGDMEEGLRAAAAIGDDTIQRRAGQRISPESFTHGTSEQRMDALRRGFESSNGTACDVYLDFN